MSRRSIVLALVLLLAAMACGRAEGARIDLGSGTRFVAEVVDPLNDAGRFPAVVATSDGRPLVAYFGLAEDLAEGEIGDTRPIGAPSVPGVLLATRNADGVWSRGAIALAAAIPNVDVAFAPAFDDAIGKLTPGTVSGLDLAIDGQDGLHAAWGSVDGLWYATGSADPASTTQWSVEKVFDSPPEGLSLAVTASGDPYLSFVSGGELRSAEGGAGAWRVNPVAPASTCPDACGTDTAIVDGAPVIAFVDRTGSVSLATTGEAGWTATPIASGRWPSLAADGAATVVAFAADASVAVVRDGGIPLDVASLDGASPLGTSVAVDAQGTVSVAWAAEGSGLGLAQGDLAPGGAFDPVATGTILGAAAPDLVALGEGAGIFLAWQETSNRDLLLGSLGEGEFAFALPSPTIEPKRDNAMPSGPPSNCVAAEGGVATVVAEGVAFTDGSCISVPAGEPFQILFDDRDDAAALGQHNIAIFPSANDLANPLFRGDLVSGPAKVTYDVDALDAGQYFFHCDVHPQMTGQVVAEGSGGGGGGTGGGGATTSAVVAMGLAFDTATIELPAGKAVTLTFDNQDAGVPHNLAIYPSATDLANPLFRGETFSGVASKDYEIPALEPGEYYFQCDVHPTMNGTVVVA